MRPPWVSWSSACLLSSPCGRASRPQGSSAHWGCSGPHSCARRKQQYLLRPQLHKSTAHTKYPRTSSLVLLRLLRTPILFLRNGIDVGHHHLTELIHSLGINPVYPPLCTRTSDHGVGRPAEALARIPDTGTPRRRRRPGNMPACAG